MEPGGLDPASIERRHPLVALDVDRATELCERAGLRLEIRSLDVIAGGHINTNYQVTTRTGDRYVFRISTRGEDVFRKEIEALDRARGIVPVPTVCASAEATPAFPYPYAVVEWVTGDGLAAALASAPDAAEPIGEAVADTLDRLGALAPPTQVEPPLRDYIHACLFEHGAAQRLGDAAARELWRVVDAGADLVTSCAGPLRFVHGDFQGDNLLLRRDAQRWTVAAVLDWEWSRAGSILIDLGSLLRLDGIAAFTRGLERGFAARGQPLPPPWRTAAKLQDLAAQCEKLTFPRHRGAVTERTLRTIARYLGELTAPA